MEKRDKFSFLNDFDLNFDEILPDFIEYSEKIKEELLEIFSYDLSKKGTGIVISGFNIDENRPSYINFELIINNNGNVEYNVLEEDNNINYSNIKAFAQSNEIEAFIYGINPELENIIIYYMKNFIDEFIKHIYKFFNDNFDFNQNKINKILFEYCEQNYFEEFHNIFNDLAFDNFYSFSFLLYVLPEVELIKLAEFLITLPSVKRKFSLDLDSVGGDISVCVIKKDNVKLIKSNEKF